MAKKRNTMVRDALILCGITLIAGLLVAFFHDLTAGPIAENEKAAKIAAYQKLFGEAAAFDQEEQTLKDAFGDSTASEYGAEVLISSGRDFGNITIDEIVAAKDSSDQVIGYIVSVTSGDGYGGDISSSVGVDPEGRITGVEILSINETAGLGMKAKEEAFRSQYINKDVTGFTVTKGEVSAQEEIAALSGATITSRAMTNSVNAALAVGLAIYGN